MKVTFDIDCTPEEARAFLGLPNVAPLQDAALKEMERRMLEAISSMDPETFVKTWLPASVQGWTDMQKMFWTQMGQMTGMAPGAAAPESAKKAEGGKK